MDLESSAANDTRFKPLDSTSSLDLPARHHQSLAGEFVSSLEYSALQTPLNGIAQAIDHFTGSKLLPKVQLVDAPAQADFASLDWHVQQLGAAVGTLLPFAVAHGCVATCLKPFRLAAETAETIELSRGWMKSRLALDTLEAGMSGLVWGGALQPAAGGQGDFWTARLKNGLIGAGTLATVSTAAAGLKSLGGLAAEKSMVGRLFTSDTASGALAGLPAGVVDALMTHGRHTRLQDIVQSAYTMSFVGGTLGWLSKPENAAGCSKANRIGSLTDSLLDNARSASKHISQSLDTLKIPGMPGLSYQGAGSGKLSSFKPLEAEAKAHIVLREDSGTDAGLGDNKGAPEKGKREQQERPLTAVQVLRNNGLADYAKLLESIPELRGVKAARADLLGQGNESCVVELGPSAKYPDGAALKISLPECGWNPDWGHRLFDAKILGKVHEVELPDGGTAYVHAQELVDTAPRYDQSLLDEFFKKVEQAKLEFADPGAGGARQLGVSRRTGDLVLVDYSAVDAKGANSTLSELINGRQAAKEQEEKIGVDADPDDSTEEDMGSMFDGDVESRRQDALKDPHLTNSQRFILEQLFQGFSVNDIATLIAAERGLIDKAGKIKDGARINREIRQVQKQALENGLLTN